MSEFYALPAHDGVLPCGFRVFFGMLMAVSILLAFAAIRRREINRHRALMMRAYAIGLGAGTQVFMLCRRDHPRPARDVRAGTLMGGAWALHLAIAEWVIRRRPSRSTR